MKTSKRKYGPEDRVKDSFTIDCSIFSRRVLIRLNVPKKDLDLELEKFGPLADEEPMGHFTVETHKEETLSYIYLPDFGNNLESMKDLAHECLLAATDMMESLGVTFGDKRINDSTMYGHDNSDEVLWFIQGYLFTKVLERTFLSE